ncbi:MAG: hypothetical protein K0R71_1705 [Bacillales bacterium]|jgi:hypothetical protein|nr:hypothetical protein [Bacillales bacterium]
MFFKVVAADAHVVEIKIIVPYLTGIVNIKHGKFIKKDFVLFL